MKKEIRLNLDEDLIRKVKGFSVGTMSKNFTLILEDYFAGNKDNTQIVESKQDDSKKPLIIVIK